jgi:hypothetical protein
MSNVIQFKGKAPVVAEPQATKQISQVGKKPMSIEATASIQVLEALMFYAGQGWDGGAKARQAMSGMSTVIESREPELLA